MSPATLTFLRNHLDRLQKDEKFLSISLETCKTDQQQLEHRLMETAMQIQDIQSMLIIAHGQEFDHAKTPTQNQD